MARDARAISIAADEAEALEIQEALEPVSIHVEEPVALVPSAGFYQSFGKRALDLVLVLIGLPLWGLAYIVIAAAILVTEGRPIHHLSARVGRDGETIRILKFRTMCVDADARLVALFATNPELASEFKTSVKLRNDPRVTRVGRLLRRSSLDELPQLLNVLRGDMSLVGPRPLLESEIDDLYANGGREILRYRPGLTGLWQVSGRSLLPYEQRFVLGTEYARTCTLSLDAKILLKTVPCVARARGAF